LIDSRQNLLTLGLGLLAIVSFWFAIASGSVPLHWSQVWHALGHGGVDTDSRIVVELRLPRATLAFCVGAMLSLSGALLQVLLRNPLADPYVLGVSGGAAVAALLSMVAGAGAALVAGNAFLGALLSMVLVFTLSGRGGTLAPLRLLLTGVVLAAGWGALISLILSIGPATDIRGMLFWLMGDLGQSRFPLVALGTMLIGLAASMMLARPLNLLVRGERVAATLGEDPLRLRRWIFVLASMLTAVAVTLAGSIGFVGLIVPHLLRLAGTTDHRRLIPNSVLLGGSLLLLADTLARTIMAPAQLPVGVVTAMLGVPLFLLLLTRTTMR
jgi:iron complex transport system permease protein